MGYWPSAQNLQLLKNAFAYSQSQQDIIAARNAKRGSFQWYLYFYPTRTSLILNTLSLLIIIGLGHLNNAFFKSTIFGLLLLLLFVLLPFLVSFLLAKAARELKLPSNKQIWKISREKFDEMCLKEGKSGEDTLNEILHDLLSVNQRYMRLMEIFFLSSILNASIDNGFLIAILNFDILQAYRNSHLGAVSLVMFAIFSFLAYFVVWIPLIRTRVLSLPFD